MPLMLPPSPMTKAADANATNAISNVYSMRSCPCSSCQQVLKTLIARASSGLHLRVASQNVTICALVDQWTPPDKRPTCERSANTGVRNIASPTRSVPASVSSLFSLVGLGHQHNALSLRRNLRTAYLRHVVEVEINRRTQR